MAKKRNHFPLQLLISFCFISYYSTSGLQLQLTRSQTGDYFNNPYCNDDRDERFCMATNSMCKPEQDDKCCYCRCHINNSTFNLTSLRCAPNSGFRPDECSYRFRNEDRFDKTYLNAIDTTDSGTGEIINSNIRNNADHFKSCSIDEVEQMNLIGYEIVSSLSHPFYMGKKHQNFYYIHWSKATVLQKGRVYRITLTCRFKSGSYTGCFMVKSTGTVSIYHPGLPESPSSVLPTWVAKTASLLSSSSFTVPLSSSPLITEIISTIQRTSQWTITSSSISQEILLPSTAKEFIKPTSSFIANSPSSTQRIIPVQSSAKEERVEVSTTTTASLTVDDRENPEATASPSPTSIITEFSASPEKEKHSSETDEDVIIYVIVVVVIFVIAVISVTVVVLFITKRKKKRMLKKRESKANIIMSDMNENNVNEDEDGFYTSLDKSAVNDESNYEALRHPATSKNQPKAKGFDEEMRQNENENVYADADRLYCTIVDDGKLGAKINDAFHANENERVYINDGEGVYSVLDTEPGQTSYPTPCSVNFKPADHGYTGDSDVEYLTVLSAKSEPDQSDCSVYADLSAQRDGENQYESLVKRKK